MSSFILLVLNNGFKKIDKQRHFGEWVVVVQEALKIGIGGFNWNAFTQTKVTNKLNHKQQMKRVAHDLRGKPWFQGKTTGIGNFTMRKLRNTISEQ